MSVGTSARGARSAPSDAGLGEVDAVDAVDDPAESQTAQPRTDLATGNGGGSTPATNGDAAESAEASVDLHDEVQPDGSADGDADSISKPERTRSTARTNARVQAPARTTARVRPDDGEAPEDFEREDNGFAEFARTRDPDLRAQLVTEHLGLAHQLARRFAKRGEPYDDLVQVASVAVIKSVDRFDPERGVEFSTFATRTVIGELKRHFRDKGWAVRAPRRIQELYLELGHAISQLSQELGRPPTVAELAATTGASEEAVLEALEAGQGYRTSSIDIPDRQEEPMANRLGDEDTRFASVDDRSVLAPALARLAPRERLILHLRFVEGLTQSEIAKHIGVSQMHVSRLLTASLARLREAFTESDD
jgi:RNA polymerase sigma-B factor